MTTLEVVDQFEIRTLIENWALWRDAADFDRLRTVWHPDGVMVATWFEGPAEQFIQASEAAWRRGVSAIHFLGGTSIEVVGDRAIAQTKMTISQRAEVDGLECDCVCTGRFYDFFQKREGRWGLALRQPIYEKDRLDPVDPAASLSLNQVKLATLPGGYRHLAYIQMGIGMTVNLNLPGARGPELDELYARGKRWLEKTV